MPKTLTAISVFLASPSDVAPERDVVEAAIDEWNNRYSRERSVYFDLLRWEKSVSASFGDDGQQVVNSQIGEYDLLIALFWSKIGSPTPRAESGTIEEYHVALRRYKADKGVGIAFLFKDVPVDFRSIDLSQAQALKDFEKEVQGAGALTKSFKDDEELRLEIGLVLDRVAREQNSGQISHLVEGGSYASSHPKRDIMEEEEEIGFFDAIDSLTKHAERAGRFLTENTVMLNKMGENTDEVTNDFSAITSVRALQPSEARPGIGKVAEGMDVYSSFVEKELPSYAENLFGMGNDVRSIIQLSYDWIGTDENMLDYLTPFRDQLSFAQSMMATTNEKTKSLYSTISSMHRTTSVFNKARRRLLKNLDTIVEANERGRSLINQGLEEIARLIVAVEEDKVKREG